MANLIKCTACPFHMDATGMAPGSALQCPNCGASVKVPAVQTGKVAAAKPVTGQVRTVTRSAIPVARPAVEAPPPPPPKAAPAPRRTGGATPVFRKAAGSRGAGRKGADDRAGTGNKKSNTPIIIGVVVVALVAVGVVVMMTMGGSGKSSGPIKPPKKEDDLDPASFSGKKTPPPDAPKEPPKMVKNELDKEDPNKVKEDEAKKKAAEDAKAKEPAKPPPATNSKDFKLEAEALLPPNYKPALDPRLLKECDDIIQRGFKPALLDKWADYFNAVCWRALNDDEKIARFSMQVLEDICAQKLNIKDGDNPLKAPWDKFNDPHIRAGFIATIMQWQKDNRAYFDALAAGKDPSKLDPVEDKVGMDSVNWDNIISTLLHFQILGDKEGKYGYPPDSPEYPTFEKVQKMGKAAYPYLVRYVDNENINWAKGAVVALRNLTGYSTPLPKNPEDQKTIKAQWLKNLGIKEGDLPK